MPLLHSDADLAPHVGAVPLVIVDRGPAGSVFGAVQVDAAGGVRDGLRHLVARAPDGSHFVGAAITMRQSHANLRDKLGLSEERDHGR